MRLYFSSCHLALSWCVLAVKMVLVNEFCDKCIVLGLLLLALTQVLTVSGQQGASLELFGVNLPNNSLVEVRDLYDVNTRGGQVPNNELARQFPTLHCFTDLEDCCNVPRSTGGEWYFPNGTALDFDLGGTTFRRNRGANGPFGPGGEIILGVVRLFHRGLPPKRGRFRCEIPTAAGVNQTLYVNILNIGPVTITATGGSNTGIAGTSFSLVCSATVETQANTPTPNFDWFFGPNNDSLPSGTTPMATVMGNTYTSTLQFSPLQESHAGMYTCRLGNNARLAVNAVVTVIMNRVYVSLRGRVYNDNMSNICITDIGEGDESLLCFAGLIQCCRDSDTPSGVGALGRWLYPNGSLVGEKGEGGDLYTERGLGVVCLNRRNNVTSPTGQFCCEVPDIGSSKNSFCVNTFDLQSQRIFCRCTNEIATTVVITIVIECLIAALIISIVVVLCYRKRKPSQKSSIRVTKSKEVRESVEEDECEYPDKLTSRGQGNCELTQCPAYEAAEMDDVHEDTDHEGNCELTQCPAYEAAEMDDVHEDTGHEGNCELTQCPAYEAAEMDHNNL